MAGEYSPARYETQRRCGWGVLPGLQLRTYDLLPMRHNLLPMRGCPACVGPGGKPPEAQAPRKMSPACESEVDSTIVGLHVDNPLPFYQCW